MPAKPALQLPDALIVRYFRGEELDQVRAVESAADRVKVEVELADGSKRTDLWRDLGGGIGYVPDAE
jgi:hypothetical protein